MNVMIGLPHPGQVGTITYKPSATLDGIVFKQAKAMRPHVLHTGDLPPSDTSPGEKYPGAALKWVDF